jgi:hypothetical protein
MGGQAADKVSAAFFIVGQCGIKEMPENTMLEEQNSHQGEMKLAIIDTLVPKEHLLRKIQKHIDLRRFCGRIWHPHHASTSFFGCGRFPSIL